MNKQRMSLIIIFVAGAAFIAGLQFNMFNKENADAVVTPANEVAVSDAITDAMQANPQDNEEVLDIVAEEGVTIPPEANFANSKDRDAYFQSDKSAYMGHVLGNPDAEIILTTYADLDGPFNRIFHETLKQVLQEYGEDQVAIAYKHFPLIQLFPNAQLLAEASECVWEQSDFVFWIFINRIFTDRETNGRTDISLLPTYVTNMGLDLESYETCMADGRYTAKVKADFDEALAVGARGTPHTVIAVRGVEETGVLNGAQTISVVRHTLDALLEQRNQY